MSLWSHSIWPWLRISPSSSLNVIYSVIITAWQWLMLLICPVFLCKLNPRKAQGKRCSRPFSSERLASPFSPSRSCLGRFILIRGGQESSAGQSSPTVRFIFRDFQATAERCCSQIMICFRVHSWNWGLCTYYPMHRWAWLLPGPSVYDAMKRPSQAEL